MSHKWTLIFTGGEKIYILTEYQVIGEVEHKLAETRWTVIDGALEHIRKGNDAWTKAKM